jgi:hypothetical protein
MGGRPPSELCGLRFELACNEHEQKLQLAATLALGTRKSATASRAVAQL